MNAQPSTFHPSTGGLRAVVVGAGRRGIVHARAALDAGALVAAVYDPDSARARALAENAGAAALGELGKALDTGANLALITSPPPIHAEQTIAALRAGCHVILEKPIALTMAEAWEIGRAAEETGRRVHVCQQQRYTVAAERARDILAGRKVALVHIWLYRQAPDIPGNWDRAWGGGHIVEWAIHPIDFCRYVMGDVDSAFAAYTEQVLAGRDGWSNWDGYSCTLRFKNGAVGSIATTYAAWPGLEHPFGLDIIADGVIVRYRRSELEVIRPNETVTYPEPHEPTVSLHRAFYHALRTGDESGIRLTYRDAVETLATVLACNRSNEAGQPVRVGDMYRATDFADSTD